MRINQHDKEKSIMFPITNSGQSALEYMMTYGWAILIIVIVAVILYSMGIFNPASSISSTITGFSGLGGVQAECLPNVGMLIQFGNAVGTPINVTEINITSPLTTSVHPNALVSQQSTSSSFFVPSAVLCSSGSRYSISVTITYTEPDQVLHGPYLSKGTVSSQPIGAGSYMQITITNTQNSATPSPMQEMITDNISYGSWYPIISRIASNYQNVAFFYQNGVSIPSWLENYSSTSFMWWIKLANGIPASSSETIYMVFGPKTTSFFNGVTVGEAPQLSTAYAKYDNGANVFNFYDNFAGTSLSSSMTASAGISYSINNGLNITGSSQFAYIEITGRSISPPAIFDFYGNPWYTGAANGFYVGGIFGTSLNTNVASLVIFNSRYYGQNSNSGGSSSISSNFATSQTLAVWSSILVSTSTSSYQMNYKGIQTISSNAPSYPQAAGFSVGSSFAGITGTIYWYRERAYPPSGVMPSISFGSIS
jgi:hypothetical protein